MSDAKQAIDIVSQLQLAHERERLTQNSTTLFSVAANEIERLREEAEALRQIVLLGCEAPPEQLREHTTAALLVTRWLPAREHNELVANLDQKVEELQLDLDEAREAARWLDPRVPDANVRDWARRRWPWLETGVPLPPSSAEIGAQAETDGSELDRFRVALMHYAERNHWGYSDVLSPDRVEDVFIASQATGEPGWQIAEEVLK
jgi:chaperonin cofactor prefoldin